MLGVFQPARFKFQDQDHLEETDLDIFASYAPETCTRSHKLGSNLIRHEASHTITVIS